jgi:hypothetical protein
MNVLVAQFVRIYASDAAYTAALLLAFGLVGTAIGVWFRAVA